MLQDRPASQASWASLLSMDITEDERWRGVAYVRVFRRLSISCLGREPKLSLGERRHHLARMLLALAAGPRRELRGTHRSRGPLVLGPLLPSAGFAPL